MKSKYSRFSKFIDFIMVLLLVAFSGFPGFYDNDSFLILFFILSFIFWILRGSKISLNIFRFILLFLFIFTFHTLIFNHLPVRSIIGFFLRLISAYLIISSFNLKSFIKNYVLLISYSVVLSLIFYIPVLIYNPLIEIYYDFSYSYVGEQDNIGNTLFFINLNFTDATSLFPRNPGPFWEPGAYGGFLIIAYFFNRFSLNNNFKLFEKLIVIGIISTFSTAAISTFMLIVLLNRIKFNLKNIILTPLILLSFIFIYDSVPFLRGKVESQFNEALTNDINRTSKNRLASFIADTRDFTKYPFFGRGISDLTRFDNVNNVKVNNRNNGVSDFLVKFGIFGFLYYFISMYRSIHFASIFLKKNYKFSLLFFLTIIILGFSEPYFLFPFFFSLIFLKNSQLS